MSAYCLHSISVFRRPRGKPTPPEARESSSTTATKTMARSQVGSQVDTRLRTPASCNSRPRCWCRFQTPQRLSNPPIFSSKYRSCIQIFFFPPLGQRDPDRSFGSHLRWGHNTNHSVRNIDRGNEQPQLPGEARR